MTFWDHLSELTDRLRVILISVFVSGALVAFWPVDMRAFTNPTELYTPFVALVLKRIVQDNLPPGAQLIAGGLMDTAYVYLMMSVLIGFLLASPIVAYELYQYITPALYEDEKRMALRLVLSFLGLFAFGCIFSYLLIVPITVKILVWFITSAGAQPLINIKDFVSMLLILVVGVGFVYTIPIYIIILVERGVIGYQYLVKNRKLIYAGFFIIAAVVTPDPTPITDIIAFVPFVFLHEATIVVCRRIDLRRQQRSRM